MNGVDAQVSSQDAAGRSICIIVETDAIETIIILLRPRARNGQLLSEAAISAVRASREGGLRLDGIHAGLQLC